MRGYWLGCCLALLLVLPIQAATSTGAPGTPPAEPPVRTVTPVHRLPAPPPTPTPTQEPASIPATKPTVPVVRRGAEFKGSLLDQAAPPQQWRGVKQPVSDQPPLREWLVFSRNLAEAQSQRQALQAFGLSIVRRQQLPELGRVISVYRVPEGRDLQQLEANLHQQFPDWQQELNLRYLPLESVIETDDELHSWGQRAIGQVRPLQPNCGAGLVLAMLDGPVNPQLAEFAGAELSYQALVGESFRPRAAAADRHGNSIAALLVGQQQVPGLLPAASLHALGVFGEDAEVGLHTRTDWLLVALDRLLGLPAPVSVVNLSFGGGYSRMLESSFQRLQPRMQFVAAAGNDGAEGLRYPAAYPGMVAVGAVDARLQRQRQSNFGAGLSVVAPGEDIWTLDEQGQGYFASGTSLAVPFVTAALALAGSVKQLRDQAQVLAVTEQGEWFGAGLVRMPACQ